MLNTALRILNLNSTFLLQSIFILLIQH